MRWLKSRIPGFLIFAATATSSNTIAAQGMPVYLKCRVEVAILRIEGKPPSDRASRTEDWRFKVDAGKISRELRNKREIYDVQVDDQEIKYSREASPYFEWFSIDRTTGALRGGIKLRYPQGTVGYREYADGIALDVLHTGMCDKDEPWQEQRKF